MLLKTPKSFCCRSSKVGGEVFLKGLYVELGIHAAGSFGTVYVRTAALHRTLFRPEVLRRLAEVQRCHPTCVVSQRPSPKRL